MNIRSKPTGIHYHSTKTISDAFDVKLYTIGIDIGGTHTHAVLCDGDEILISVNKTNLDNDKCGIVETIQSLLLAANKIVVVHPSEIRAVMVGTTRFVNNILQSKDLSKVFTIRLGAPATTAITPAPDWPQKLKTFIGGKYAIIGGGYEFTGEEISTVDPNVVESLAHQIIAEGINCIAVSCVFSHINPTQELMVYKILKKVNPDFRIVLSHQIGDLGLIARENATILNAAITYAFESYCQEIETALIEANLINASLFLSSNTGTIEKADKIFPIQTYGSGPSNSIRGATRLLSFHSKYSIVADIGGTSTDVGINVNGFPMQAGCEINIGDDEEGFSCNFPSPLTLSCGLGGGSIVTVDQDNQITVGPISVGRDLKTLAKCFGGNVLTVTDIAIAKNRLSGIGNKAFLNDIPMTIIEKADGYIHQKLAGIINATILYINSTEALQLILVGGGSSLFDLNKLRALLDSSIRDVVIPEHAASANAIGAAIAMVHGEYNKIYSYEEKSTVKGMSRELAIADARAKAFKNATDKGADPITIKEMGVTEIPLNYLPGALHHIKVEVIGRFNIKNVNLLPVSTDTKISYLNPICNLAKVQERIVTLDQSNAISTSKINPHKKQFFQDLALGAGLLGSGGGGDTSLGVLMINQLLEKGHELPWIDLNSLDDENDLVIGVAAFGTPTVGIEKLFSQEELVLVVNQYEKILGKKITAIIPIEGAGFNALLPIVVSAMCNKPLLNADCMGRAFPELQMTLPFIYGKDEISYHAVISNCKDANYVNANDPIELEKNARNLTIKKGGTVMISCMLMTGKQAKSWCIPGTLSFCQAIGALIRTTRHDNKVTQLRNLCEGSVYGPINSLGSGKIIELNRCTDGGFNRGWMIIETINNDKIKIEFQNENLRAINCTTKHVLAIVPDIITLLDVKGKAISSEKLKVGLDISLILTIAAPALLKTPTALAVIGPEKFQLSAITHVRSTKNLSLHPSAKTINEESLQQPSGNLVMSMKTRTPN